jgi:hypothetical protein
MRELGYFPGEENEECLIPTHSHLLGAWVEAGILGAVFWMWVFVLALRSLAVSFRYSDRLIPLIVFIAFFLIWDVFFSPYGAERRFVTTYYVVVLISVHTLVKRASVGWSLNSVARWGSIT